FQHARRSREGRAAVRSGRGMEPSWRQGQGAAVLRTPDCRCADVGPDAEGPRVDGDGRGAEVQRDELRRMPQINEHGKKNLRYYWGRIIAANVVASVIVLTVFSGVTWQTPPRVALVAFGVAFLFSSCIGPLIGIVMPHVAPLIWSRLRF